MKRYTDPDKMQLASHEVRVTSRWFRIILPICIIALLAGIVGTVYRHLTWEGNGNDNEFGRSEGEDKPDGPGSSEPPPDFPTWYRGVLRVTGGRSSGSGFLVRPQYVVTNAHVVAAAPGGEVTIHFSKEDKEDSISGTVVWQGLPNGKKEDIALIKVPSQDKSFVCKLGESALVTQTEKVRILGYPLGVEERTITEGTISRIQRTSKMLQTDAVVNMGNSGGPIVSLKQNAVIGLVVSEADRVEGQRVIEGTNYAIAIDHVWSEIEGQTK